MKRFPHYTVTILAVCAMTACIGLFAQSGFAGEPARIADGSNVTLLYHITVPGDDKFDVRDFSQFVQGQHQLIPALERAVAGLKRGDKTKVELSPDQGFGPYDPNKKKEVPADELPAGTKAGDILEDRAGQQATVAQMSDHSAVMDYNH
ncbi:MAG TPA: FKBP-type peptidyl-prolyl cis-trans isomerase, partial [Nitrospira sp.]